MLIKLLALLLLVSSCALFKSKPSLQDQNKEKLLNSVKVNGEGRGRLSLGQNQYVFSVDSILNDDKDWILAVAIPLHGEEVMILPDLRKPQVQNSETESFEARIQYEFRRRKLNKHISSESFLQELRSLIRFILASELDLKRHCNAQGKEMMCKLGEEKYFVSVSGNSFFVKKEFGRGNILELVAKNLTDSFFSNTDFFLYTNEGEMKRKEPSFSLELFW